jgi:hypothetical protein
MVVLGGVWALAVVVATAVTLGGGEHGGHGQEVRRHDSDWLPFVAFFALS